MLDFFKVRRCQIKIRRDPTFPGCLYSEMKMCLAPCFAGCSKEEYDAEVNRLVQFLDTDGNSLRAAIELEREKASDDLDFERAATIHKRIEKLDDALRGKPDLARRIQDLNAVILQRSAEDQTIAAFAIRGGRFIDPCYIRFAEIAGQPRSAEQIFRNYLESNSISDPNATPVGATPSASRIELGEHLWLLARWYYSNPREGEIFFREKDWPYRKILRACSRLLLPKESEAAATNKTEATTNSSPAPMTSDQGKKTKQRPHTTSATPAGTAKYAQRFPGRAADGHFRESQGLVLSSIGIGTYLGPPTDKADQAYAACVAASVEKGINVIDSAINYRFQRSERSIGAAIKHLTKQGFSREEFVICTKGGYLTPDGSMPSDPNDYFYREYIQPGILTPNDIVGGSHCMTPRFLENQLGRSLKNLGVDCIDVYYLHNPESQLGEISRPDFRGAHPRRLRLSRIHGASWKNSVLRHGHLERLPSGSSCSRRHATRRNRHHRPRNRRRQSSLPLRPAPFQSRHDRSPHARQSIRQRQRKNRMEAASDLGITLVASASLLQGQVTRNLPPFVAEAFGLESDAQRALQFVRSPPASPPPWSAWPTPSTSSPTPSSSPSRPPPSINSASSSPAANPPSLTPSKGLSS